MTAAAMNRAERMGAPSRPPPAAGTTGPSGSGRPLDPDVRSSMERRFGHDFGGVRVHTDEEAAASAREVGARAYTVGRDIVFGTAQYAPDTVAGRRLLAHELTHTLQQASGTGQSAGAEAQADDLADVVAFTAAPANTASLLPCGPCLQRQESTAGPPRVNAEIADLPGTLYVDLFEHAYYDYDYRHVGGNLSKWLTVVYPDGTVIDVNLDDILDMSMSAEDGLASMAQGHVGDGGRIYPRHMNSRTTPRLDAAKQSALEAMDEYNVNFILLAMPAVLFIITMPLSVRSPRGAVRTAVPRRIASAPAAPAASTLNQTLAAALRPNVMRHVFGKAQHGLAPLVRTVGTEEGVMRAVVNQLARAALPQAGQYEVVVIVSGVSVTVRGAVVNGIIRVSTLFVRP